MNKILLISDLHLGHNKEFIYAVRGFETIEQHDKAMVDNWNDRIDDADEVYLLGDVMLGDIENGLKLLKSLSGKIHIIRGNHDTDEKIKRYQECDNVVEIVDAKYFRYGGMTFYMSHFPAMISAGDFTDSASYDMVSSGKLKKMKNAFINLYGHTHQKTNFYSQNGENHPYMYHVGVDSHNMRPVLLEDIVAEIRKEKNRYDGKHQES